MDMAGLSQRSAIWDIAAGRPGYPLGMAAAGESHHPGTKVTDSGICECDGGCGHSTNVRGHTFPPLPEGCKGGGWRLTTRTPRDGGQDSSLE
jgi:hypothetical protein